MKKFVSENRFYSVFFLLNYFADTFEISGQVLKKLTRLNMITGNFWGVDGSTKTKAFKLLSDHNCSNVGC